MSRPILFGSLVLLALSVTVIVIGSMVTDPYESSWLPVAVGVAFLAVGGLAAYFVVALRGVSASLRSVKSDLVLLRNRTAKMSETALRETAVRTAVATATATVTASNETSIAAATKDLRAAIGNAQKPASAALGELSAALVALNRENAKNHQAIAGRILETVDEQETSREARILEALEQSRAALIASIEEQIGAGQGSAPVPANGQIVGDHIVRQVEGLMALYELLEPGTALPELGGWATASDLAAYLVRLTVDQKPDLIVEAGSGVSTALLGRALQRNGHGRVIALEHEPRYVEATRKLIDDMEVADYAEVVHCPLVTVELTAGTYRWYDLSRVSLPNLIDILIVDGPPEATGPLARYPAVPLMISNLAADATVVMDDASRPGESQIADLWMRRHPGFEIERRKDVRGTAVLRRTGI